MPSGPLTPPHRPRRYLALAAFTTTLSLLAPGAAAAQESREAQIAAAQAAKAAVLSPAGFNRAEQRFVRTKNKLVNPPTGFFTAFGSVMTSGGFAIGPGYRYVVNDTTTVLARGLWSIRGYKQADVAVDALRLADGLVNVRVAAGWRDATQVPFYGVGMNPVVRPIRGDDGELDTGHHGRANFRLEQVWVGGEVEFRPAGVLLLGGAAAFEQHDLGRGRGGHPSIEERYTDAEALGLGQNLTYLHTQGTLGMDWRRPAAGYARRGGRYAVSVHDFRDTDDDFTFGRIDADVVQHLPVLRESLVLSLHGRIESTLGDDAVPFFLLPSLGGSSSLRGFSSFRFRDRHSVLMSAEYRWTPSRAALDAVIFIDSGKVAARRGDLDFDGLKTSVGFGLRLHTRVTTPLRIELARSNEGLRLIFGTSAAF